MSQTTIAVDCDEVLSHTADALLTYHDYTFNGMKINKEDLHSYELSSLTKFNASRDDAIRFFRDFFEDPSGRGTIQPIEGARTKLDERRAAGHRLIVVTARRHEYREFTKKRVEEHFPNTFSDLFCTGYYTDERIEKSQVCKQVDAAHLIEDNLIYAHEASIAGINTFLLDKPWNRHYDEEKHGAIIKVDDRHDIRLSHA